MSASITYRSYLRLPELLSTQSPLSDAHDELLFISIHQASEIWMKLCLHELRQARRNIQADILAPALKMMARVARIQAQLIQSWEVLATMTPADYTTMRDSLGTSSGFQSDQYRQIEFMMGAKQARFIAVHEGEPAVQAVLQRELETPSLYDEAIRLLSRRGFDLPQPVLDLPAVLGREGLVRRSIVSRRKRCHLRGCRFRRSICSLSFPRRPRKAEGPRKANRSGRGEPGGIIKTYNGLGKRPVSSTPGLIRKDGDLVSQCHHAESLGNSVKDHTLS